jgi:tetratricopeptide (TPR) repeat protein
MRPFVRYCGPPLGIAALLVGVQGADARTSYLQQCLAPDATDRLRLEACAFAGRDDALGAPDRAAALARRAETILAKINKERNRFDLRDMARADLVVARRLMPDDPDIQRLYIALNEHWTGKTEDQLAAVNTVIASEGEDSGLLLKRSVAHFRRGALEKALADVKRAIELDARNVDAYIVEGQILTGMLRNTESVAAFSKAIELAPDRQDIKLQRMGPALASQQFEIARDDGQAALTGAQAKAHLWDILGVADYMLQDYKAAEAAFVEHFKLERSAMRVLVWRFLAASRAGTADIAGAAEQAAQLGERWPSAVFRYFAGTGSEADVMAQAAASPVELRPARISQAHFYIGEWNLLMGGPRAAAREHFAAVVAAGFVFGTAMETSLGEQTAINENSILEVSAATARLKEMAQ